MKNQKPEARSQKSEALAELLDEYRYLLQRELHIKHSGF
jgi:hypothetical protein